ncbi:alpha/beta fold hydrolase [Marichromatium gracile]|uniref:Pimeloyl-ACP methyl ester carboxylesterase n=1 Tax=Marichromatium gracile TaxID=1048 RepID=A0A4R4AGW3_MARGR|nr:alpha/beta fold hydrolase [Marichromatium gracile]MBK1707966.1 alpha/beta hydrolase [Marichromatium gracile]TCW38481.1 pimeloyl-ACP methyl ester carboxylesterase [Marichromatium gracile]
MSNAAQSSTAADVQHVAQRATLGDALDAQRGTLQAAGGRLAYYADTTATGRPLVLIHSINAAPSSYELRPLFEHYRGKRPVYSLELPGFGHSERSARSYTPELFATAIHEFLEQVVGAPADLLALSLSSEFAARAALTAPARVASLTLISPTGFSERELPSERTGQILRRVLTLPLLGRALYALVASRPSIRHYLGRSFTATPPQALIDYAHATSHQPGAHHAPLHFLSTLLFTRKARERLYGRLTDLPVLVIADRDPYIDFAALPGFIANHPNWRSEPLAPHLGLPHWERPEATIAALDTFWASA